MNRPTPPSRKIAKPKSRQANRSTATVSSAAPSTNATPAEASVTPEAPVVKPEPTASKAKAPKADATPQTKPVFIDTEEHTEEKHPRQHQRGRGKWRKQPQAAQPETSASEPQEAVETGPQTRHLTLLGNKTVYSDRYTPAILEAFDNRHPENDYFVKFNCPEFTSLCPITGQPDFATIYINYIPDRKMVESKSLKLYLFGFRNHGAFHEDCVNIIMKDLIKLMSPRYIEVWGKFLPRGGLSIDPYANYGRPTTRWEEFARQRLLMHDLAPERVDNR